MTYESPLLTNKDVAELLGVTTRSIYEGAKWKQIRCRIGDHDRFVREKVIRLLQNEINEAKELIDRNENAIAQLSVARKAERIKSTGNRLFLKNGHWYTYQDLIKLREQHRDTAK